MKKGGKKQNKWMNDKLDKKLAEKVFKELEAQYAGGFAQQAALGKKEEKAIGVKKPGASRLYDPVLVASMEKRLSTLDGLTKVQRADIKKKTEDLEIMEKELGKLKKEVSKEKYESYNKQRAENECIEKENADIRAFLAEYGLNWVGKEGKFNIADLRANLNAKGPTYRSSLPKEIDISVIMKRIEVLNSVAERDSKKLISKEGVHRMVPVDPLSIAFYKNGVKIEGFPFHPYHSKEAMAMLSDILDGFFPYDLKEKYPDGAPLKVLDHVNEHFEMKSQESAPAFVGKSTTTEDSTSAPFPTPPAKPSVASAAPNPSSQAISISTHVDEKESQNKPFDPSEITNLRIRTQTGKHYLVLRLLATDPIDLVYKLAEPFSETPTKFTIRTTFPRQEFPRSSSSLRELSLVPSAALVMQ